MEIPNDYIVPQIFWSHVPFYKSGTFDGPQPSTITDFFDVEKFPGKRGIRYWPNAIIEMALVADGIAIKEVYNVMSTESGIDRASALNIIRAGEPWFHNGKNIMEHMPTRNYKLTFADSLNCSAKFQPAKIVSSEPNKRDHSIFVRKSARQFCRSQQFWYYF